MLLVAVHPSHFMIVIAAQEASYNFRHARVPRPGPTYRFSMGLSEAFKGDLRDYDTDNAIKAARPASQ